MSRRNVQVSVSPAGYAGTWEHQDAIGATGEVAAAIRANEATPSPDTGALTKLHNYLFAHRDAIDMSWCAKVIEEVRVELTAAQAEIQRLREELKIVVGICSSDTLPRKEQS